MRQVRTRDLAGSKEAHNGNVKVLSMGPPKAEKAIREALSMGCDDGILLSDKKFAGADTWSTSYVLAEAIRTMGNFDIIITGIRATDGDTGQVGPEIAAMLDLPLATFVSKIIEIGKDFIIVERLVEGGYETIKMPLPCLMTVLIGRNSLTISYKQKMLCDIIDCNTFKIKNLATRKNCRNDFVLFGGGKDKFGVCRRLFKSFQKCVKCG